MIAKKMTVLRFEGAAEQVAAGIEQRPFVELTAAEVRSEGFISPGVGYPCAALQGDLLAFKVRIDSKKVPGSAVSSELAKRVEMISEREGYRPGRKQQKEIKEQIIDEFVLKAIPSVGFVEGWFDFKNKFLLVAESSSSRVDSVLSLLIKSCPGLLIRPIKTKSNPSLVMTSWVLGEDALGEVSLDDKAIIEFTTGGRASISAVSVTADHVIQLADNNLGRVVELAITVDSKWSFVLTEDLVIKGLSHVDIESEVTNSEDDTLFADALINTSTAAKIFARLFEEFGGELLPDREGVDQPDSILEAA